MVQGNRIQPWKKPLSPSKAVQLLISFDECVLGKVRGVRLGAGHAASQIEDGLLITLDEHGKSIHITIQNG